MALSLSLHNSAICRRIPVTFFACSPHMINNFNDNREKRKKRGKLKACTMKEIS